MSEEGHGLQIVNITQTHSYELQEKELAQLLLRDDIKDLPVVVVSVAGAYRGGKSFLLNFFIRYLASPYSAQRDGSWLGEDSAPLVGFKWRSGIKATTMGVLMWSEPFVTTLPTGEKVAILLVDTQGSFDRKSSVRDSSTVFALSTLMSSIQIYNISKDIKEDNLQHLELFTEYSKLVKSENGKSFQVLEFLVRDWQWADENYPYGAIGGAKLLQDKLAISEDQPNEMKELRKHIISSFETVSCVLMPHPGLAVLQGNYDGKINAISRDFRSHLITLVNSIFSPSKLLPKKINGEQVKSRELYNYFKTYVEVFNSSDVPNPTNIYEATVKAVLLSAVGEARDKYEDGMDKDTGIKQSGLAAVDVEYLHNKYVKEALQVFDDKKKLGTSQQFAEYRNNLNEELQQRLPPFLLSNLSKIQVAVEKAKDAYQKAVEQMNQPICMTNKQLSILHETFINDALNAYARLIKRVTNEDDRDQLKLREDLNKKLTTLRRENDQNNKIAINERYRNFWQIMQNEVSRDPPLSDYEFSLKKISVYKDTLWDFDEARHSDHNQPDDNYRSMLRKKMDDGFDDLRSMNNRRLEEIKLEREEAERRQREEEGRRRREEAQRRRDERRRQIQWERRQEEERRRRERERSCAML